MEIAQLKLRLKEIIDRYDQTIEHLRNTVLEDTGFAYYQSVTAPPLSGNKARERIADYLALRNWSDKGRSPEEIEKDLFQFMVVQASPTTVDAIGLVNASKNEFKTFHTEVRSQRMKEHGETEMKASEYFRSLLPAGDEYLNPHIIDRGIPLIDGCPSKVKFTIQISRFSQRKTIADAQNALRKKLDKAPIEEHAAELMAEIDELDNKPSDFPVVFRNRKPVKTLKFRAANVIKDGQRSTASGYARSPIFYASDLSLSPKITLPKELTGGVKTKRRGRPPVVSDIPVSRSLPDWFWYIEGKEPSPRDDISTEQHTDGEKRNSLSKTVVSGIWLANNPLRFEVSRMKGGQTSVTIDCFDVEGSWKKALKKRFGSDYSELQFKELSPPTKFQIEEFSKER